MAGGIQWLTLPAGYLGSSFIGAALIVCGFNTVASKVRAVQLVENCRPRLTCFYCWLRGAGVLSRIGGWIPSHAVVGETGLVDDLHDRTGHCSARRLLVYRSRCRCVTARHSSVRVADQIRDALTCFRPLDSALRYFVLFIGVLSATYSCWDIVDDLVLRKVNESDASVFAKRYGGSSQCYGVLFGIISLASLIGGIFIGLVAFKDNGSSAVFLPTRF